MTKRVLALILAAMMGLMLLAGCGGEKDPDTDPAASDAPDASTAPEESAEPTPAGPEAILATYPKKDMGGYEFIINFFGMHFTPTDITSPVDEAKDNRNRMIEEYFNMKFVHHHVGPNEAFESGQPAILGGDKFADMLAQTMWATSYFLCNNLLVDLNTVSTLNLKADYYDQQIIKAATMNGKTYELGGDANKDLGWAFAFNKRLIEDNDKLESPYELINRNEWTFDKFREMCRIVKDDVNGDGVMTNADDIWGHCGPAGDYQQALAAATTLPLVGEKDGQMKLMLDNPKWPAYCKNIGGLFTEDGTFMDKDPGAAWDSIIPHFKAGRCLFYGYMAGGLMGVIRDMDDDCGIVPMPKAEASQKNYGAWIDHNAPMIGMTVSNRNLEDSGMIIDAMYNLSSTMVVPVVMETNAGLYLRDDESLQMINLIADSPYYDATYFLRHGIPDVGPAAGVVVEVINGTAEFASKYEEVSGVIQDALDTFFKQGAYAE